MPILLRKLTFFVYLGHMGLFIGMQFDFLQEVSFRVRYGAHLSEEPQKNEVLVFLVIFAPPLSVLFPFFPPGNLSRRRTVMFGLFRAAGHTHGCSTSPTDRSSTDHLQIIYTSSTHHRPRLCWWSRAFEADLFSILYDLQYVSRVVLGWDPYSQSTRSRYGTRYNFFFLLVWICTIQILHNLSKWRVRDLDHLRSSWSARGVKWNPWKEEQTPIYFTAVAKGTPKRGK